MSRRRRIVDEYDDEETKNGSLSLEAESAAQSQETAAVETMFSSQFPEATQDILPAKDNERNNFLQLSEEKREKAITDLTRVVLFKALVHEPIDRVKCAKEAGISEAKITSVVFEEVKIRLKNIFGFEIVRIPPWIEKLKGLPFKYQNRFFVVNSVYDATGKHSKAIHSIHDASSIEKGFLMVVLALTYCQGCTRPDGSRWILDKDLYKLLNHLDENIPADPPSGNRKKRSQSQQSARFEGGSGGVGVGQTPDVDVLLEKFCNRDYLIRTKATEEQVTVNQAVETDSMFYTMGPRAAVEIGRKQIIYFCAELLDVDPDPTMLQELEGEDDEEGSPEINTQMS